MSMLQIPVRQRRTTESGGALRVGHSAGVSASAEHVAVDLEPGRGSHTSLRLAADHVRIVGFWVLNCATASSERPRG